MPNKILRPLLVLLVAAQLGISGYHIGRWFKGALNSYFAYAKVPKEERIFTTAFSEYYCSLYVNKNLALDANILWVPQVSAMVNYYIYPRKIYHIKGAESTESIVLDKNFLSAKGIKYVFFDYDKFYPVESVRIVSGDDKTITLSKP